MGANSSCMYGRKYPWEVVILICSLLKQVGTHNFYNSQNNCTIWNAWYLKLKIMKYPLTSLLKL